MLDLWHGLGLGGDCGVEGHSDAASSALSKAAKLPTNTSPFAWLPLHQDFLADIQLM